MTRFGVLLTYYYHHKLSSSVYLSWTRVIIRLSCGSFTFTEAGNFAKRLFLKIYWEIGSTYIQIQIVWNVQNYFNIFNKYYYNIANPCWTTNYGFKIIDEDRGIIVSLIGLIFNLNQSTMQLSCTFKNVENNIEFYWYYINNDL